MSQEKQEEQATLRTDSPTYRSAVWMAEQKSYKVILILGTVFLAILMLAVCPVLLAGDVSAFGRFPQGARIADLPVGGLTKPEALELCRAKLSSTAAAPLSLEVDGERWSVRAAEVGFQLDYQAMVDAAYDRAWNVSVTERMIRRFLGKPRAVNQPVVTRYDRDAVSAFVRRAIPSINCKPRNAYMDVSSGSAVLIKPRDGRETDINQVMAAVEQGLKTGNHDIEVPIVNRTPAKVQNFEIGKFVLVNQGTHTVRLYDREQLIAEWPCAVGSPKYPTCLGEWKVVKVEKNPTWYNRGSTWAENMPPSIGPGPNNPLGTRAITINGGGVLLHGTPDPSSVGYSVSHGCVRMRIPDVEALYPHCYIGMPVYIIKESGSPGFDCSKRPFWWGKE